MPYVLHHAGVHACHMYFIMQECMHAVCTSSCRSARMPCVLHHAGVHTCRMYFIMQECTHAVYTHHAGVHACCMY